VKRERSEPVAAVAGERARATSEVEADVAPPATSPTTN
jgi:hypothetical protein